MAKYILKITLFLLPFLSIIALVNIFMDPGEVFQNRNTEVSRLMLGGNNIVKPAIPSNWADLHIAFLKERKKMGLPKYATVVWGSSRSSLITQKLIGRKNFHNFCLPGCNIMDLVALSQIFEENNFLPDTLILNLDPWMFYARKQVLTEGDAFYVLDSTRTIQCQKTLREPFIKIIEKLRLDLDSFSLKQGNDEDWKNKMNALFSPSYFQSSIKNLSKLNKPTTSADFIPGSFVLRHDGSYSLSRWNKKFVPQVNQAAITHSAICKDNFFYEPCVRSPHYALLESLTRYLESKGVKIYYFMAPVHPYLYPADKADHGTVLENEIRKTAAKSNAEMIGSFNPYKFPDLVTHKYFTDSYHVSKEGIDTLVHQELERLKF